MSVSHIVLYNKYRADSPLFGPDHRPQIRKINISTSDNQNVHAPILNYISHIFYVSFLFLSFPFLKEVFANVFKKLIFRVKILCADYLSVPIEHPWHPFPHITDEFIIKRMGHAGNFLYADFRPAIPAE